MRTYRSGMRAYLLLAPSLSLYIYTHMYICIYIYIYILNVTNALSEAQYMCTWGLTAERATMPCLDVRSCVGNAEVLPRRHVKTTTRVFNDSFSLSGVHLMNKVLEHAIVVCMLLLNPWLESIAYTCHWKL